MRKPLLFLLCASFWPLVIGCDSKAPLPEKQHLGALFPLPDGKGYFEIKTQAGAAGRGGRAPRTKTTGKPFLVYFYQADGITAMSPAPSDVVIKLGSSEKNTTITLTPEPGESAGTVFSAPPGQYPEAFRGELSATINGQAVTAPFMFR